VSVDVNNAVDFDPHAYSPLIALGFRQAKMRSVKHRYTGVQSSDDLPVDTGRDTHRKSIAKPAWTADNYVQTIYYAIVFSVFPTTESSRSTDSTSIPSVRPSVNPSKQRRLSARDKFYFSVGLRLGTWKQYLQL